MNYYGHKLVFKKSKFCHKHHNGLKSHSTKFWKFLAYFDAKIILNMKRFSLDWIPNWILSVKYVHHSFSPWLQILFVLKGFFKHFIIFYSPNLIFEKFRKTRLDIVTQYSNRGPHKNKGLRNFLWFSHQQQLMTKFKNRSKIFFSNYILFTFVIWGHGTVSTG